VSLDTDALSAVADDEPAVVRVYRQAASMELPVIVLSEDRFGIRQSRRRGEYERWLRELIAATTCAGRSATWRSEYYLSDNFRASSSK